MMSNHLPRKQSLKFYLVQRLVKSGITEKITEFSYPSDVITLSNGMQVGRLSIDKAHFYAYPMLLIGNKQICPTGRYGAPVLKQFLECLNQEDAEIVLKLAAKVTAERARHEVPVWNG